MERNPILEEVKGFDGETASERSEEQLKPNLRQVEQFPVHNQVTLGTYLAQRFDQIGVRSFFTVPGDFILTLLDELLKSPSLRMVNCCNELNAGYAADGYCRSSGQLGVAVVTYCVGGFSILNAVAGAYSEDLPLLIISGGPNTNDGQERHLVHHTIGESEVNLLI